MNNSYLFRQTYLIAQKYNRIFFIYFLCVFYLKFMTELVTDGSMRTITTDGSQSGASISSNCGHKHQRKHRRRNKSWKCQAADVMGPITRMMFDQNSLLNLCLKQGKLCQALQVVKVFFFLQVKAE